MRVLRDFTTQGAKVTLFQWNNRYLIKIELGPFEQTFKVDEFDFADDSEVVELIDETFVAEAIARFPEMARSLGEAQERSQNNPT